MALHLAARRRLEFEGGEVSDSGSSISAAAARGVRETRFNPAQYLQGHGWQGHGVPLDGHRGKGLKKPLAIPQKRDNKGLGGNRDRAVEWWDCLFEASAKALASGQSSSTSSLAPSGTSSPNGTSGSKLSLQGLAKREQARRQLMSNFRRGATIQMGPSPDELPKQKDLAAESGRSKSAKSGKDKSSTSKSDKKEKKLAKAARKEAKERKRADKDAKKARRAEKEARRAAKRDKKTAREAKKQTKKESRIAAKAASKSTGIKSKADQD